ncbi:unnamed protein product, partial [Effrenium voratum]
ALSRPPAQLRIRSLEWSLTVKVSSGRNAQSRSLRIDNNFRELQHAKEPDDHRGFRLQGLQGCERDPWQLHLDDEQPGHLQTGVYICSGAGEDFFKDWLANFQEIYEDSASLQMLDRTGLRS